MSRSIKGSKGGGYEFWSRRPFSGHGCGREIKTLTHRAERRIAKRGIYCELRDL